MRTIELPILGDNGEPLIGRLPMLGDRYDLIGAVSVFSGWRAPDFVAPDDAGADWYPTPSESVLMHDLGYAFAACLGLCWPTPLPDATIDDWRELRHTATERHDHVVSYGERAFEALVELGIGQGDIFKGGQLMHERLSESVPDPAKSSRLADFSPALPATTISD